MRITIESTSKIVSLDGIPCRIWEGETERGVPCHCFIPLIAPTLDQHDPANAGKFAEFDRDLLQAKHPTEAMDVYPTRMIL